MVIAFCRCCCLPCSSLLLWKNLFQSEVLALVSTDTISEVSSYCRKRRQLVHVCVSANFNLEFTPAIDDGYAVSDRGGGGAGVGVGWGGGVAYVW